MLSPFRPSLYKDVKRHGTLIPKIPKTGRLRCEQMLLQLIGSLRGRSGGTSDDARRVTANRLSLRCRDTYRIEGAISALADRSATQTCNDLVRVRLPERVKTQVLLVRGCFVQALPSWLLGALAGIE